MPQVCLLDLGAEAVALVDGRQAEGEGGSMLLRAMKHKQAAYCCAFVPGSAGKLLASGGRDSCARVWSTATGEQVYKLETSTVVKCMAFAVGGASLMLGLSDATISVWRSTAGRAIANAVVESSSSFTNEAGPWRQHTLLRGHANHLSGVAFSADGLTAFSTAHDNTVRLPAATIPSSQGRPRVLCARGTCPRWWPT